MNEEVSSAARYCDLGRTGKPQTGEAVNEHEGRVRTEQAPIHQRSVTAGGGVSGVADFWEATDLTREAGLLE